MIPAEPQDWSDLDDHAPAPPPFVGLLSDGTGGPACTCGGPWPIYCPEHPDEDFIRRVRMRRAARRLLETDTDAIVGDTGTSG